MKLKVKDRIILKSIELFYIQGIHNTGINQIIAESNAAKASFYQHFPSKDDLVYECLDVYNYRISEKIQLLTDESSDLKVFFDKWISSIKDNIEAFTYMGCPVANARFSLMHSNDGKYHEKFAEIIESWISIISSFLNRLKKEGNLSEKVEVNVLSRRIVHLYEGAITMWKLTRDEKYLDDLLLIAHDLGYY